MTTSDFVHMVEKMRAAQRDFSRAKNPLVLKECKALESIVDKAIGNYTAPKDTQKKLPLEGGE
jgi:hypothetical protein